VFEAYALTPRQGASTLRVADGQLAYDAPVPKTVAAVTKLRRRRPFVARRHEKLAA
jgi:hypothetical protein